MKISLLIQQLQQHLAEHEDIDLDVAIRRKGEDPETIFGTEFVSLDYREDPEGNYVVLLAE